MTPPRVARGRRLGRALIVALGVTAAACNSALPDAESPAAHLYVRRCGTCHPPYNPKLMTPKMWETMVVRMESEMRRRGLDLPPGDKVTILDYLTRNAG